MLPHRAAHRAGALAVDDAHLVELAQHRAVQEEIQGADGLVRRHAPEIHLRRGPHGPQLVLRPLNHLLGGFLGLPLHHPNLVLLGGDLQDAGLELEGAVLVHAEDGGLGAHLHQLHRVPRPGRAGGGRRGLLGPLAQLALRLVEAVEQGGALVVDPLPVLLLALAAAHLVQLPEGLLGGVPGLVQDGPGLRLGLLHRLGPLGLQLGLVLPAGLGRLLHLPAELCRGLLLFLHLVALLVQLGEHVLKADIFRVDAGGGLLDDLLGQAQPLRDGEGVGLAGDSYKEPVGGGQGVHVELAGGVLHPRSGHGVHLQLGVVGGGGHQGPHLPGAVDDGGGQGRALDGVGARPQLVKEDQGAVVRLLQDAHDVHHVGGEGGQALGDGLLVPHVGQHPVEHPDAAVVPHRDVEAALGHEGEQADGLEGDGLAAGVGAGDHQGVEVLPQHQVVGHRLVRIQQGVAGLAQVEALLRDFGRAGAHPVGQLGLGEDHVQEDEQAVVLGDVLPELGAVGGQLRQDALDLLLLPGLELLELVVGLHHPHGLDEEGGAGGGHVVDQAGHVVFVLRLHRHHEAVVALGDDGLLEVLGLVGGDELVQNVPHLGGGGPDVPPDGGQLRAGRVGDLVLPQDGAGDLLLQEAVGRQGAEQVVDAGLGPVALPLAVLLGGAGRPQHGGDVQQLPGVQRAPHVGPLEGGGHRLDAGQGGTAPQGGHLDGGTGLVQGPLHVVGVGQGAQSQAALLALLRHRLLRQALQHLGQL